MRATVSAAVLYLAMALPPNPLGAELSALGGMRDRRRRDQGSKSILHPGPRLVGVLLPLEQPSVNAEGDRRRGVPQLPRHKHNVVPLADQRRREAVAQVMEAQTLHRLPR